MIESKFKHTELGKIPLDWEVRNVSDVAENFTGLTYSPDQTNSHGTLVLRSSNIQNGLLAFDNNVFVDMKIPQRAIVREGDVLICVRNGSKALIGKSARITKEAAGMAFGAFMTILRAKEIDQLFCLYLWQSTSIQKQVQESLGATINQITNSDFHAYKVAVPNSVYEQTRIASALSEMDDLLSSLDKVIAKKQAIKEGTMQQLLTGKTRLKGFDDAWETFSIGKDCLVKARIGWQGLTTSEYLEYGDYGLITGTDIKDGRVQWDTCHFVDEERYAQDPHIIVQPYDVLVTKDGTIGKVAVVDNKLPFPSTLNSGVFVIRSKNDKLSQRGLSLAFLSPAFEDFIRRLTAGSTIVHLYQKDIVNFEFKLPATEAEQLAIVSMIESLDNELSMLLAKRKKYEAIKQGMMQQLLTGKIRLI